MKKIILSIFILCSITNIFNSMEMDENNNNNISRNTNYFELPIETWSEIASHLININLAIKNLETAKTIPECKKIVLGIIEHLKNFALISKKHYSAAKYLINNHKFVINGKKITLKEYYNQRKNEILQKIKEQNESYGLPLLDNIYGHNDSGFTALMNTAIFGFIKTARLLIENEVKLDKQDCNGFTALIYSVHERNTIIAQMLINNGANLNIQDNDGQTALIEAVIRDNKKITELLIKKHANLDIKNNKGWTALMYAAYYGDNNVVQFLIDNRANLNIKNNDDETAFDIAINRKHLETAELIKNSFNLEIDNLITNNINNNNNNNDNKITTSEIRFGHNDCTIQ